MRLVLHGVCGGHQRHRYCANHSCASIYDELDPGRTRILIDAGSSAIFDDIIPTTAIDTLLLSHLHKDHRTQLEPLLKRLCKEKPKVALAIYAPESLDGMLKYYIRRGFAITVSDQPPAQLKGFELKYMITPHRKKNYAYLFKRGGKELCYTGDTGYSAELAAFCAGVDVLVAEATYSEKHSRLARLWGHCTPNDVAELARSARPRLLVLTHFLSLPGEEFAAEVAKGYSGQIVVGREGLELSF